MFTPEMMESVKRVEAIRAERMKTEPRRMTAEEKSCRAADNRHAQKDTAALKNISRPSLLIFIHILWWFGRKPL